MTRLIEPILAGRGVRFQRGFGGMTLRPRTGRTRAAIAALNVLWVANYYSARNPLRLSSLVILGVVARMFRCATRSSCWCT